MNVCRWHLTFYLRAPSLVMKLAAAFSILSYLSAALSAGFRPTFRAVIQSPSLLFKPSALSKVFFGNLWVPYGNGVDDRSRAVKSHLITPNAYGVVLDIGAGCMLSTTFAFPC
jgi:hypothetical protein